jgi:hypothetical protein
MVSFALSHQDTQFSPRGQLIVDLQIKTCRKNAVGSIKSCKESRKEIKVKQCCH